MNESYDSQKKKKKAAAPPLHRFRRGPAPVAAAIRQQEMSPRGKKMSSRRSELLVPFGCFKIHCLYKQGIRAQRAMNRRLFALMKEIESMQRQFNYQHHGPDILRWEEFPPFGGSVLRGDRSHKDYTGSWSCMCGSENGPSRRWLFDIPALQCRLCGREADEDVDFDFVYDNTLLNGIPMIRKIRQQVKGQCSKYAWTAAAEIDEAIELGLEGKTLSDVNPVPLVAQDLVKKHEVYQNMILEANNRLENFHIEACNRVFDIAEFELVGAITKVCGIRAQGKKKKIHKIQSCRKLDKNDFAEICTAIADGPVVATFRPGQNLTDLAPGQVYKATDAEKFLSGNYKDEHHAVVLIGAGRRRQKRYFYFLNSWGEKFCCRVSRKEKILPGGIGLLRFKDLSSDPIHLRRNAKI